VGRGWADAAQQIEQRRGLNRLFEKGLCAALQGALAYERAGMAGHDDDRELASLFAQQVEQLDAVHARQVDVGDQHVLVGRLGLGQQVPRIGECRRLQALAGEQEAQRFSDGPVVVEDEDHRGMRMNSDNLGLSARPAFDMGEP
jgi:hypothetical protein